MSETKSQKYQKLLKLTLFYSSFGFCCFDGEDGGFFRAVGCGGDLDVGVGEGFSWLESVVVIYEMKYGMIYGEICDDICGEICFLIRNTGITY